MYIHIYVYELFTYVKSHETLLRISISQTTATTRDKRERDNFLYLLESAGEGGFRVSGEQHSLGDGDLSRLVTGSKWRPAGPWCPAASVLLILWSWLPCMAPCPPPATPSTGMPFSERNSSRSTYYQQKSETLFPRWLLGILSILSRTYLTLLHKSG